MQYIFLKQLGIIGEPIQDFWGNKLKEKFTRQIIKLINMTQLSHLAI